MDYRNKIEIEVQCYIFDHHEEKDITAEYRVCDRKPMKPVLTAVIITVMTPISSGFVWRRAFFKRRHSRGVIMKNAADMRSV